MPISIAHVMGFVIQTISSTLPVSRIHEIRSSRSGIGSDVADLKTCLRISSVHFDSFM